MAERDQAVAVAMHASEQLGNVFHRHLGSKDAPNGHILSAYRQARKALGKVDLASGTALALLLSILRDLRTTVTLIIQVSLQEAATLGSQQAMNEMRIYGLPAADIEPPTTAAQSAWEATYDAQAALILALAVNGDMATILGDDVRVGALTPAPVIREGARWLELAAISAHSAAIIAAITQAGRQAEFARQAVATLDARTTDCCQRVDGQMVGLNEPFRLTGTPRYADSMMNPGFHDYCRTTVAFVRR